MSILLNKVLKPCRQKKYKNTLITIAVIMVCSIVLSWLYLCKISYPCSPTRLLTTYVGGVFFWIVVIPGINKGIQYLKDSKFSQQMVLGILFLGGIALVVINQFFVSKIVQLAYWVLWSYAEPNPSWVDEVISNNIVINFLFFGMVAHLAWSNSRSVQQHEVKKDESILKDENPAVFSSTISIKDGNTLHKVDLTDIRFIHVEQNCIHINTFSKKFIMYTSLVKFAENLPANLFVKIHRSVIVNQTMIRQVRNLPVGDAEVVLECGTVLKCSRNYKKNLAEHLN